jgi:hypothetical protein
MLLEKQLQGMIKEAMANIIIASGEGILNDDGVDETVANGIADECLEKTMSMIAEAGYFVIEGLESDLANRFGINKADLPKELLDAVHNDVQQNFDGAVSEAYNEALHVINRGRLANMFGNLTTILFWDCDCILNYIHPKDEPTCKECGCRKDEQPDSMLREVIRQELI